MLSETAVSQDEQEAQGGWKKQWTLKRALLPRRPNLDWKMEQDCSLYYRYRSPRDEGAMKGEHEEEDGEGEIEKR